MRQVKQAEMQYGQKPHSHGDDPQARVISQIQRTSVRSNRFEFYIRHPNSWDLYQRDKSPKYLALKTKRSKELKETETPRLEGSRTHSRYDPAQKQQVRGHLHHM